MAVAQGKQPDGNGVNGASGSSPGSGGGPGGSTGGGPPTPPVPGQAPPPMPGMPPQPPGYAPGPVGAPAPGFGGPGGTPGYGAGGPGYGPPQDGGWYGHGTPGGPVGPGNPIQPGQPGGPATWSTPGPPGPPAPRPSGGKIAAIVIACVLGLALIGGGGLVVALTTDSGSSAADEPDVPSNALDVAWKSSKIPRSTASSGSSVQWPARWVGDNTLVYGDEHGVRSYDITTGKEKWQVEPPKGAGEPCAMSPEASSNGVGAVLFDSGGDECTYLAAIDLDTGAVTWSKKIPSAYGANVPRIYAGTEHITVGLNSVEEVQLFDVQTGAVSDPLASAPMKCRYSYIFSARHIVAKPECSDEMVILNTQYGGPATTVSDQQGEPVKILSDHPLRVAVTVGEGESSPPRVLNFEQDGENVKAVDLTGKAAEMAFGDKDNAVTPGGLYFGALRGGSNAVLDLTTGKVVWEGNGSGTSYVGYDDTGEHMVIAESDPDQSYWTRVGTLDPATGKLSYAGTMVLADGTYLSRSRALYAYSTNTVLAIGERPDGKRMIAAFDVSLPTN